MLKMKLGDYFMGEINIANHSLAGRSSKKAYDEDGTHFCENGANVVAGLVAKAVKDQQISGLYGYVK